MMPEGYARWRGEFAAALDPRFHSIGYVDGLVWYGRARLFANDQAAVLAEIKPYPTGACDVHVLVGAGDLHALVALEPELAAWGRRHNCLGVLIESRAGWAKVMKKHGYEPHQVAVRKDLIPRRCIHGPVLEKDQDHADRLKLDGAEAHQLFEQCQ